MIADRRYQPMEIHTRMKDVNGDYGYSYTAMVE